MPPSTDAAVASRTGRTAYIVQILHKAEESVNADRCQIRPAVYAKPEPTPRIQSPC